MKININITVEIDPEDWTTTFGVDTPEEIRSDVKNYIGAGIQGWGVFGSGEVEAREWNWK
jgi:hypothetical protein